MCHQILNEKGGEHPSSIRHLSSTRLETHSKGLFPTSHKGLLVAVWACARRSGYKSSTNTSVDAVAALLIYYCRCCRCPAVQLQQQAVWRVLELKMKEPDSSRTIRGVVGSVGDAGTPVLGVDDRRTDMELRKIFR